MITIVFGDPRIGKTAYVVGRLLERAFDYERNRLMREALQIKNANGFNLSIPTHCVSANYDVKFIKSGYSPRKARIIDPRKLGFGVTEKKTHFLLPYETIAIQEAQEFFNSRAYSDFESWRSNLFEQHGHNHLDFFLDTQRPGLIDVNIRAISNFVEIRKLDVVYDKLGLFKSVSWNVREFDNMGCVEEYMRSGKKDRSLYTAKRVTCLSNVFDMYSSWSLEPKFYAGHLDEDFDLVYTKHHGETKEDYKQFLEDIA